MGPALLRRLRDWTGPRALEDFDADRLRVVSAAEGIDFATALLYAAVVASERHAPFIERVRRDPRPRDASVHSRGARPLLAVVPGAFYREHRDTGADGRRILEMAPALGYEAELVPIGSFDTLQRGADALLAWLRARAGQPVVLLSLSKGGAEVKMALATPDAARAFTGVRGWVSLSGMLNGTPLVDWLLRQRLRTLAVRLLFAARRYSLQALLDLAQGAGAPLDFEPAVPAHIRIVHIIGFPLVRHLSSPAARRGHRRLASLGPNDGGGILLADACRFPGVVYPIWGADHYLRLTDRVERVIARTLADIAAG
jgi:hypothetical protein